MWQLILLILLALAAGVGAAMVYGGARWREGTDHQRARLFSARAPIAPAMYDPSEIEQLPPPVQRYFRAALKEGQRIIAVVRFTHTGTFNMGETTPSWRRFSSNQIVTTRPPGFDWNGQIRMAPGLNAFVHDAYVAGKVRCTPSSLDWSPSPICAAHQNSHKGNFSGTWRKRCVPDGPATESRCELDAD